MMGLPRLPSKLPSRNWLIFWTVTTSFAGAIIYDKREKNRATAKWRRAVAPLAEEKLASPNQLPRKLTIYLESPPGDGLRVAQNHFVEYVKPVLAASGLDWEFVQGRQQGDVRAAVAEKIRQARKKSERPNEELASTDEASLEALRKKMGLPEYEGIKGDIVIGRHTWKEYIRGLHEGWLGPLDPPPKPVVELLPAVPDASAPQDGADANSDSEKKESEEKEKEKEKKPDRPPQPVPHNKPEDYQSAILPAAIPAEFSPSTTIPFPHRLGFVHTFVRLGWFLNRRKLADDIGREVAAVCYATSRDYTTTEEDGGRQYEQQTILDREETDWPKSVWKPEVPAEDDSDKQSPTAPKPAKELVWTNPMVVDPRVADRMRRFQITPEHEAIAAQVKVPEEEIEGWIKGSLRSLWRWGASSFESKPQGPNVGNLNDE
jgi:import inner membrane translocase subunit TIM54